MGTGIFDQKVIIPHARKCLTDDTQCWNRSGIERIEADRTAEGLSADPWAPGPIIGSKHRQKLERLILGLSSDSLWPFIEVSIVASAWFPESNALSAKCRVKTSI